MLRHTTMSNSLQDKPMCKKEKKTNSNQKFKKMLKNIVA